MGAGLSKKQFNSRVYNRLQSIKHKLEAAGIAVIYRRYQLFPDVSNLEHGHVFNISCRRINASNGECAGLFEVLVGTADGVTERYGWDKKDGDFERGLQRIKELFLVPTEQTKREADPTYAEFISDLPHPKK